jgi:hypothetical protein
LKLYNETALNCGPDARRRCTFLSSLDTLRSECDAQIKESRI